MELLDIIYTPLDILPRPELDIINFKKWLSSVYPQDCLTKTPAYNNSMKKLNNSYPWDLTFGMANGKWQSNFDVEFPEYSKYLYESVGILREEVVSIIFLPIRDNVTGLAFWHSDVDDLGFRFYVENDKYLENPLLVKNTVEPLISRLVAPVPIADDDTRFQPEVLSCKMIGPTQAFYITNVRGIHSPFINVPSTRIACFVNVYPALRNQVRERTKELILRSAEKYKEYAILW